MTLRGRRPVCRTTGDRAVCVKRILVAAMVLALSVCVPVSRSIAASADEVAYTEGLQAVRAGDNARAVSLFSRAIELNPRDFRYFNDRGIAYKASGNFEKALEDYTRALSIKPDYPNALNNRGLLFVTMGRFDKAEEDFRRALKSGSFEAKIHTNLGMALAGKGDDKAAVKEFQNAMTFRPMDPRAFFYMAQSLEKLGNKDQALKMYQVALGMVKDPGTEDRIEKRISALEKLLPREAKTVRPQAPPESLIKHAVDRSRDVHTQAAQVAQLARQAQPVQVARSTKAHREIVRARPVAVPPAHANEGRVAACEPLPASLEELDRRTRTRALEKFSPNAAEIFRQGVQFMDQADTKMAIVRFEDTLQLEKRNKNALAVAWSTLQAGRAYLKIGDRVKASANIEAAFRIFQRLRASDEVVLALVDMASIKKASGQKEQASRLLSEALHEATSSNKQEIASVLRDLIAGRTPATKERVASKAVPAKKEDKKAPAAAPADSSTQNARMELVKRGEVAKPKTPDVKVATQSAVPKEKKAEAPVVAAQPSKAAPSAPPKPRGPVTWGRPKAEPREAAKPQEAPQNRVAEQPAKPQPEPPAAVAGKAPMRPEPVTPSKPVTVETGVGGAPTPVFPTPVQPAHKSKHVPEHQKETRSADARQKPAVQPDPVISQLMDSNHRLSREERREAANKRISGDLTELKRFNAAGDETSMIVVLERLARRFTLRRQYDKALHGLTASLALREKLHLDGPSARLFDERGMIKQKVGDRAGALEDLTRALVLAESRRDTSIDRVALQARCGALAREMGLDPDAILSAYRLLWKARGAGDGRGETDALHTIGTLYDKAQKPSEALNYYERAAASVLTDKARVYGKLGKQKLAEQSYKEALEAFKRLDYSRYLAVLKESGLDSTLSTRPRR